MKKTNQQTNATNIAINPQRRKTLTGFIVGGASVVIWQKPIINAVVLPAHAQTSALLDFFATTADASEANTVAEFLLEAIVPSAHALISTNELPLVDLKFEAQAIDQGSGQYQMKIAAEELPSTNGRISPQPTRDFVFGWEGTVSGLNSNSTFSATGCAQSEDVKITAISSNSLTIEMSYFSKTIQLILDAGSASLPSFPLLCAQ